MLRNKAVILFLFGLFLSVSLQAQMYNDGGLRLRVWAHKVWSAANCGDLGDQEYNIKDIRSRVLNSAGSGYITSGGISTYFSGDENRFYSFNPSQVGWATAPGMPMEAPGYKMLDIFYTGTQAPTDFEVYMGYAFEDDCSGDVLSCGQGNALQYDQCCCVDIPFIGTVCALGDDYFAPAGGWGSVNFRSGPEGQVNYTMPLFLNAGDENRYAVVYAYQWDWITSKPLCSTFPNYRDGNVTVTCDLVGVFSDNDWDAGFCGLRTAGDVDLRLKLLAKDNLTASFPDFPTNTGSAIKVSQGYPRWNSIAPVNIFNKTYNTTDVNFSAIDLAWDMWEEDGYYLSILGLGISCGTEDNYEGSDYGFPWFCINGDDTHITSRSGPPGSPVLTGATINWRESPPNTYKLCEIPVRIGSGDYDNWMLKFRYRWTIGSPTVTIPTADLQGCIGTAIPLTATTTNATYYQWQVADQNGLSPGDCPAGANWSNVPGAVCPSINFPQTAGTRTYRLVVYNRNGTGSTSSSGSKYDSAVSQCVRVTYFPYAPPIISTACGKSVASGSSINFTVPAVPALNAIGDDLSGWSYAWSISPATNVSPTTATGTTFTPTFTAAAAGTTYTVTLTVSDPCGAANATSTCTFNVTTPSCDQIYVAPAANGGSDANPGTATQPYASIAYALLNVSGARNHIRIMGGTTYNETQWTIPANAILDGGWEIVNLANGDWRKNSALTTTVNLNPSLENNGTVGYYRGVISGGNGWFMQDLVLNVKNGVNQPTGTFNSRGLTIYGIYANGTTGWEIKRTQIFTGNGTTGANGTTPGGTGGAGGGATSGGAGGSGSTDGCNGSGMSSGQNGSAGTANGGSAGAAGSGGSWNTGSDCNALGCDAYGVDGYNGTSGGNGGTGSGYAPGVKPGIPAAASPFYTPAGLSASGSSGGGGGKGGGGGGGDIGTCCTCLLGESCGTPIRPNGGAGGNGGNGGLGGSGGGGGGGSFGIYLVNSATGTLNQSSVSAGTGGSGGSGANGQPGSPGQNGQTGTYTDRDCGESRKRGGNGGNGGDGGAGGRGQDGADGLAQSIVTLTSSTLAQNGCGASACVGAASPNTAPSPAGELLKARYTKGCTNSFIEIQKANTASTFDLAAMGATLVYDESPNTSTYTNTNATTVTQVKFSSAGWKLEDNTAALPWTTFIRIIEDRAILPQITTTPKKICSSESVDFTITGNSPNQDYTTPSGSAIDYEWRYRKYKDGQVRTTPVPAWTTGTGIGPNTITLTNTTSDTVTYLISARVRDKCCGWSVWVYDSVLVAPALNPPTAWTVCPGSPASGSNVCLSSAQTLCVNTPVLPAGNPVYAQVQYRYSTDNGTTWSAWSVTNPSPISKVIGTTRVQTMIVIPSPYSNNTSANCDTAVYGSDIYWNIDDTVSAAANVADINTCNAPNPLAILTAALPSTGTGQWTWVSGSPGVSSTPPVPTDSLSILVDLPFGSNATYRWTVTNGACSQFKDLYVATAPVNNANITQLSDACYICYIRDGSTYTYYDYIGKVVARVQDLSGGSYSTNELANTEACVHIHPYTQSTITPYLDSMPYLRRYWTISPDLSTDAMVTLYFTAQEYTDLKIRAATTAYAFNTVNDLQVSKFPGGGGGAFTPPHTPGGIIIPDRIFSAFSGNGTDYEVTFFCNSFSTFYIHPVRFPYEVLPVELVSFTGTNLGSRNRLEWVTASELNTDRFVVEKSLDGVNWFYLGERPAAGNSSTRLTYELFDELPVTGNNYYRLKIVDRDSSYEYSNIINIPLLAGNSGAIGLYPNPTTAAVTVLLSATAAYDAQVTVYDVLGQVVYVSTTSMQPGLNKPEFNFSSLAAASYILGITDQSGKEQRFKFVKQ